MQHDPQPAACNGNCGRVVLFPSRQKLFKHLREKHGVPGFQRRGRESRKRRQEERSPLHGGPDRQQPRSVPGPHRQWIRPVVPRATNPGTSSARGASSPVIGAISPEKASLVDVQGSSLAMSAISPKMGVTSPAMALSQSSETGAILPEMASPPPGTGAISSAKASPSPARAPASANAPPPGSCPVSSETGAISSAKASTSLERATRERQYRLQWRQRQLGICPADPAQLPRPRTHGHGSIDNISPVPNTLPRRQHGPPPWPRALRQILPRLWHKLVFDRRPTIGSSALR